MSQFYVQGTGGGGGGGIVTINGDSGSITGTTVTVFADHVASNAGGSVAFVNSGTTSTLNTTDANGNVFIGKSAGNTTLSGNSNTALGQNSIPLLISGSYNIALGRNAGASYSVGTESSNIIVGYNQTGTAGESNVLRIGSNGTGNGEQNTAFIAGILGNTVANPVSVTIDTITGQLGQTASAPGGAVATKVTMQVFTSSGTYTPTSGMQYCIVECIGGGGAGGAAVDTTAGGGGGAGGYARSVFTAANIGASQSATIGAAGLGGSGTGGNGGSSSLGSLIVSTGGSGGVLGALGAVEGGTGGAGTTGQFMTVGNPGASGVVIHTPVGDNFTVSGSGGSSFFGGGALSSVTVSGTLSSNATSYGGGGGGASNVGGGSTTNGGNGFAGIIVITEFSPGTPITSPTITNITNSDSPYTVLPSDYYISANVTSGTITILLPNNPASDLTFIVKDVALLSATNNITITTVGGSVLIDGATSYTINVNGISRSFIWNSFTGAYEVF